MNRKRLTPVGTFVFWLFDHRLPALVFACLALTSASPAASSASNSPEALADSSVSDPSARSGPKYQLDPKYKLDPWALHFVWENDVVSTQKKDRHYSNGLLLAIDGPGWDCDPSTSWSDIRNFWRRTQPLGAGATPRQCRIGVRGGQLFYTPDKIEVVDLIPDDRPYAGWIFGGIEFSLQSPRSNHRWSLDMGMVGPESKAEETQTWFHEDVLNKNPPMGWHNQLQSEFGVLVGYSYKRRICEWRASMSGSGVCGLRSKASGVRYFDLSPGGRVNLGNVFTTFEAGARFRLGWNVPNALDDDGIQSLLEVSQEGEKPRCCGEAWSVYGFGGAAARVVGHNIFLDGNSSKDSHSVDKYPLVGDFEAGLVLRWDFIALTYTHVFRSPEFKGDPAEHRWHDYGSAKLSFFFGRCCFM